MERPGFGDRVQGINWVGWDMLYLWIFTTRSVSECSAKTRLGASQRRRWSGSQEWKLLLFGKHGTRWKLWLDPTPLTSCFERTVTNNPETSTIDGAFMFSRGYFCSDFCFIIYLKYPCTRNQCAIQGEICKITIRRFSLYWINRASDTQTDAKLISTSGPK